MIFNRQFLLSLLPFVAARPAAKENNLQSRAVTLDQFIASENTYAFNGVFNNIGTKAGGKAGLIVASPSTSDPNYFYTWTRDSALTTHGLLDVASSSQQAQVISFLNDYITAQTALQKTSNPSGSLSDLSGLGEPKFNMDGSAFLGAWGRPQRDGPPLRALALMKYVELFPSSASSRKAEIDTLIKNDLDYAVKYWQQSTFDLWEEVQGNSFFTSVSQFHALALGSAYFKTSDATRSASYLSTSKQIRCYTDSSYWNGSTYLSNINNNAGRGGLDTNSVIAAQLFPTSPSPAYTSDPCASGFFSPCSDRMLASTYRVVESFRGIYAINSAREAAGSKALAIGRYKEDVYYGGNPWFISTLAPAEQLYRANSIYNQVGKITITSTSLPFFKNLVSTATVGTYTKGDGNFEKVVAAISAYADGFMSIVQQYTPSSGALAEQVKRDTGAPISARDLTWSYVSFLTATHYRAQQTTATAPTGTAIFTDSTCSGGGTAGTVPVNFKVTKQTAYGQNIYLAGSAAALGGWDLSKAVPLSANSYTTSNPIWVTSAAVNLPASSAFQYKYVLKGTDGSYTYENGNNRQYTTPASGTTNLADTWQA